MSRSRYPGSLIAAFVIAAALAGCVGNDDVPEPGGSPRESETEAPVITDDLFGWIRDAALDAVTGVRLTVVGAEAEATTDENGFYGFPRLPRQENLIVIAEHARFTTQSKVVLLPVEGSMRLNFTLEPRPVKVGHMEVLDFSGLLACQGVFAVQEGHYAASSGPLRAADDDDENETVKADCGFADPNNADRWEFSIGPDVAGVIIQAKWEAESALSEAFHMSVETTGFGAEDAVLAEVTGPSVLTAQITKHQAERFYAEGGIVRVSFQVDPNMEDEEQGLGVAIAYQQEFEVLASVFYVDPAPATYTAF